MHALFLSAAERFRLTPSRMQIELGRYVHLSLKALGIQKLVASLAFDRKRYLLSGLLWGAALNAKLLPLDQRSLNTDTFNPIYVLMGHALSEPAANRIL